MNAAIETSVVDCHPASAPDYTPVAELRALQFERLARHVSVRPLR
jgi:hypothetical protein